MRVSPEEEVKLECQRPRAACSVGVRKRSSQTEVAPRSRVRPDLWEHLLRCQWAVRALASLHFASRLEGRALVGEGGRETDS